MSLNPKHLTVAALLLIFMGAGFVQTSFRYSEQGQDGVPGQATVVDVKKRRSGTKRNRSSTYRAEIQIDGIPGNHTNKVRERVGRGLVPGQRVPVVYPPSNPSNFLIGTLEDARRRGRSGHFYFPIGLVLLLGGTVAGGFVLYQRVQRL